MESNKKAKVNMDMDVIVEILSRMRAKDLIRFKSVCKHWFEVISSKLFIKLHLNNSRSEVPHSQIHYFIGPRPHRNFLLRPRPQWEGSVLFVGNSSDGLMCLLNTESGNIHIWNPSIRQSACFQTNIIPDPVVCFWFGNHDDEYKLVLGTGPGSWYYRDVEYQMHLMRPYLDCHSYKSTSQGLRKSENIHFCHERGTLFSDYVHWDVSFKGLRYILCYNIREEKVGRISMPEAHRVLDQELGEMDGCFCALIRVGNGHEVWVMKEYGVEESWTKLMFIDYEIRRIFKSVSTFRSPEGCVESLVSPNQGAFCANSCGCSE